MRLSRKNARMKEDGRFETIDHVRRAHLSSVAQERSQDAAPRASNALEMVTTWATTVVKVGKRCFDITIDMILIPGQ